MTKNLLLKKDENVCKFKPVFDLLQKKDLKFLPPIDVSSLVDASFINLDLPKIYLWSQISDPNLGIHDFLKVEGEKSAQFKWVVVGQEILPIEKFCDKDSHPCDIQLWDVMNKLHEIGKFPTYFVAEGEYEGLDGIHFCLTPFNDNTSCDVLETLFGSEFIKDFHDREVDLQGCFNPDAVEYCNDLFTDHFKKTLGLNWVRINLRNYWKSFVYCEGFFLKFKRFYDVIYFIYMFVKCALCGCICY